MYAAFAPGAVAAGVAGDRWIDAQRVPEIDKAIVESLLTIMAARMLSVATLDCDPEHGQLSRLVGELNRLYRQTPALHELACVPGGFVWENAGDAKHSV